MGSIPTARAKFFTSKMLKALQQGFAPYIKELEKVEWPKIEELQVNTVTVLVASLLLAILIAFMDFIAQGVMTFLYGLF